VYYVLSGIAQLAGLALIIVGAVQMSTSRRSAKREVPPVRFTPSVGFDRATGNPNMGALSITASF